MTNKPADEIGVAVWVECSSIQEMARKYAQPSHLAEVVVFSGREWLSHLHTFVGGLLPSDRSRCLATPLFDDHSWDAWRAEPVEQVLIRISTPWFPDLIQQEALCTALQPIIDLSKQAPVGHEALVRGRYHGREIGPAALFEAARAHDGLMELDETAVRTSIRTAQFFLPEDQKLFLNIVPMAMVGNPARINRIWRYCEEVAFDPSRIVFELIESDALPPLEDLRTLFAALRSQGSRVALDDVGIGHNSIAHISALRPDYVKVDRNLLPHSPDDAVMPLLQGLVAFATKQGIEMVAEGIETTCQLEAVQSAGFGLGQGWLFGRPVVSDLASILAVD